MAAVGVGLVSSRRETDAPGRGARVSEDMVSIAVETLGLVPPFDRLGREELIGLGRVATIRYLAAGETLFAEGNDRLPRFFVVRRGSVELTRKVDGAARIVERCEEGDVFGIRAHMVDAPYSATARALEDTLVYGIPFDAFRRLMDQQPELALHFAADRKSTRLNSSHYS